RSDGEWLVPVLWFDDDEITQRGYALAANRTHDLGGGYDDARLLEELESQLRASALPGTGYDAEDVEALRRKLNQQTTEDAATLNRQMSMQYKVIIECVSEQQQAELIERFAGEGLTCRALIT